MNVDGVKLADLCTHTDERGCLTEIFRESWVGSRPLQWNHVRSNQSVLRGVHGHFRHTDYLVLLDGSALIGLHDLRLDSPTCGESGIIHLRASKQQMLTIPPGVAHGFYFPEPSVLTYSVTHYWEGDDELGCRWDDPALKLNWPFTTALISDRDAALPSLSVFAAQMREKLAAQALERSFPSGLDSEIRYA